MHEIKAWLQKWADTIEYVGAICLWAVRSIRDFPDHPAKGRKPNPTTETDKKAP